MLTRRLILLKRSAAPQMSECMAKPDKQFAGPASPDARTRSLYQTDELSWHTELPTLASEKRERGRDGNERKKREGEKRRKPQQMKNSVDSCRFWGLSVCCETHVVLHWPIAIKLRDLNAANLMAQQGMCLGPVDGSGGCCDFCKNLKRLKRFLKFFNLQSSPDTHVQDNKDLN